MLAARSDGEVLDPDQSLALLASSSKGAVKISTHFCDVMRRCQSMATHRYVAGVMNCAEDEQDQAHRLL
jgi:hypothetical protein